LELACSGNKDLVISGSCLELLIINGQARIEQENYIPKLSLEHVGTLRIRDADFQEDSSPLVVEHLHTRNTDAYALKSFLNSQSQTLQSFVNIRSRPSYVVNENEFFCNKQIFSNLVYVKGINLNYLTLDNFPNVVFLLGCMMIGNFINRPCDLLYKRFKREGKYFSSSKDAFQASFGYDLVMILDNFSKEQDKFLQKTFPKKDVDMSLSIIGRLKEDNLDKLIFWTQSFTRGQISISCSN
jgi:hypothetical protein